MSIFRVYFVSISRVYFRSVVAIFVLSCLMLLFTSSSRAHTSLPLSNNCAHWVYVFVFTSSAYAQLILCVLFWHLVQQKTNETGPPFQSSGALGHMKLAVFYHRSDVGSPSVLPSCPSRRQCRNRTTRIDNEILNN